MFLNFGQKHPLALFPAFFRAGVGGLPDLSSFEGKVVGVEGLDPATVREGLEWLASE